MTEPVTDAVSGPSDAPESTEPDVWTPYINRAARRRMVKLWGKRLKTMQSVGPEPKKSPVVKFGE